VTTFSCADLGRLTHEVATAWRAGSGRDWSVPAGTLEWSCANTADHAVDTLLAPAFFLASRRVDGYPEYGAFTPGPTASPGMLVEALEALEALEASSRILAAIVTAAPPDTRAVLSRRPRVETGPPADFVPRGALELILHAHDVCLGLRVPFAPSSDLCDRLVRHTRGWPLWAAAAGWRPPEVTPDPWRALLAASGRSPV
jgi:hypothetical protein